MLHELHTNCPCPLNILQQLLHEIKAAQVKCSNISFHHFMFSTLCDTTYKNVQYQYRKQIILQRISVTFIWKTFFMLNILFIQVKHLDGKIIKPAKCKRLVNTNIFSATFVCNKFVLTNIILNTVYNYLCNCRFQYMYKTHLK